MSDNCRGGPLWPPVYRHEVFYSCGEALLVRVDKEPTFSMDDLNHEHILTTHTVYRVGRAG